MSSQQRLSSKEQPERIEIEEYDQTRKVVATYIKTASTASADQEERIDVQRNKPPRNYSKELLGAFLPVGYPRSVTRDYLEYQIYDSLQAFSSSIAGMLSSRAVLEGIGVGSTHTTPTNALLLSILQESLGRIATILFASRLGPALEAECKRYRLLADIFNDCAMILDCLSPALPTTSRVLLLSGSSVLRALCGVTAGSSKASLSQHFAKNNNVADLSAKDSSQETIISLLGMLAGSALITYITTPIATWTSLLFLLAIHLYTNYRAVRAVCLPALNQQRANLVFSSLISSMEDPIEPRKTFQAARKRAPPARLPPGTESHGPPEVHFQERIFEQSNIIRWEGGEILASCRLGIKLSELLDALPKTNLNPVSGSYKGPSSSGLSILLDIFKDLNHILWFDAQRKTCLIILKSHSQGVCLQAWFHALLLLRYQRRATETNVLRQKIDDNNERYASWKLMDLNGIDGVEMQRQFGALNATATYIRTQWGSVEELLTIARWDLNVKAMLTTGTRNWVRIEGEQRDLSSSESEQSEEEESEEK